MFKALLMDLDDTLIKSSKMYDRALEFASYYLAEKNNLKLTEFFPIVKRKDTLIRKNFPTVHTRHSRILVYRHALEEAGVNYSLSDLPTAEDIYWEFFDENVSLYDGVFDALKTIRTEGVKIAVVSDGDLRGRIRKIEAVGLLPYIDQVFASEETIFEKPFSAIFTLALSRLKVTAGESIMVGNNYKNDIQGAQLVGIKGAIFNPSEDGHVEGQDPEVVADYEFAHYDELPEIILRS
ncbi:HAD family hydrolase [bacterium]|nr:HAD family hydrolase [bacterium]